MTSVISYLSSSSFGPHATKAMGEAFDLACKDLVPGQPDVVRDVIAKRIIAAAVNGERDPERLGKIALRAFRLVRHAG